MDCNVFNDIADQVPSDPSQLKFHTAFRSSRDIDGNETLPVPAFELDSMPKMVSLNVVPVWEAGYTGRGVVVTILDDGNRAASKSFPRVSTPICVSAGVETNHTDLVQNYVSNSSLYHPRSCQIFRFCGFACADVFSRWRRTRKPVRISMGKTEIRPLDMIVQKRHIMEPGKRLCFIQLLGGPFSELFFARCAGEVAMQANNNFCGVGIILWL